ncbi:MAG: NAD-dependent malic enzyme [Fibrobacterota bacterium]|nr:NAD-dependent malic enzyme [Fibrobacterota bacterium]QQS04035.1 MAG: NAD-dependent malic enzyme [Fibrobacterota bacterium]
MSRRIPADLRGVDLLRNPLWNKGTAFTERERDQLGLRGLLPAPVRSMEQQALRVLSNIRSKADDLERYLYLIGLQDRNETLFYRVLVDNLEELMPFVYTPTVGKGCQVFGRVFRRPRGLYISADDRGRVREVMGNWPQKDVQVILPTDGERILGLGDLGASGMGIPIGKLSLYTACAGIDPAACMPVMIDVGTENEEFLNDPLYLGLKRHRLKGQEYDDLIHEFMEVCKELHPHALVQFEDFANHNAFRLLEKYRHTHCTFNDDIQGTGSVALAGLLSSLRATGRKITEERVLFLGAGEAATGIGEMIAATMVDEGLSEADARARCWFVDSKGLVVASRKDLTHHKLPWAHEAEYLPTLADAIERIRPTTLIGASGMPGTFTPEILQAMARHNERPVIFALSNPTSKAECTAEAAYVHTDGRALFASGSPFPSVHHKGVTHVPGQGNNVYIFPGVGLGAIATQSSEVTDRMFLIAARTLASLVRPEELATGNLYPSLSRIREVSGIIALEVAREVFRTGLAGIQEPTDLQALIDSCRFTPDYADYV